MAGNIIIRNAELTRAVAVLMGKTARLVLRYIVLIEFIGSVEQQMTSETYSRV